MVSGPTMGVNRKPSAEQADPPRWFPSMSDQEGTDPDDMTPDDDSDEDYEEGNARKSQRSQKPTEKARQVKSPSTLKIGNTPKFPPELDRGRFPRDRRVRTPFYVTLLIERLAEATASLF